MCGLSALISHFTSVPEIDAFKDLFTMSALRGKDSSGVFTVAKKHAEKGFRLNTAHSLGHPLDFFDYADFGKMFDGGEGTKCLVGHARYATVGAPNIDNAHPFEFENVVGVHNGTINAHFKYKDKFQTDSEALYYLINEVGIEKALNELNGSPAYALIWFDKKAETLNILRNKERPLYYLFNDANDCVMLSSEYYFLLAAAARRNFSVVKNRVCVCEADTLYTIPILEPQALRKWTSKPCKPTPPPFTVRQSYGGSSPATTNTPPWKDEETVSTVWARPNYDINTLPPKKGEVVVAQPAVTNQPFRAKGLPLNKRVKWYYGHNNIPFTVDEYARKTQEGCSLCEKVPTLNQTLHWKNPVEFLCDPCYVEVKREVARVGL